MKRLKDRDQAAVGTVTIVLLALGLLVAFNADDLPIIGGGTTYTAEFKESAGLRPGNEVRLAGVKVGAVRSVELARNKVVVDFRVDDVSLGDRSTVSIEIKTLLGDKYLGIASAGSEPQSANDPIPVDRTRTPFDIVPAVGKLSQTVNQIDTKQLAQSFQVLSDTFANSPQHIKDTLTGLSQLSAVLSTRDEQLQKLFSDASLLLGELQFRREAVHALLTGTANLANELRGLVADNQELLQPTLNSLDQVATILAKNQKNLNDSLHSLAPYVRMFNNVVGNGRWFEGYICGLLPPTTDLGIFDINPQGCETPLAYTGGGR
jgi:phospholipid/cholesterol/gamma-HCH transport system substrate-binding protein